jgi:hypothetical protein
MQFNRYLSTFVALFVACTCATRTHAAATILTNGNSSVTIDDRNGMTVWRVNNTADNVFLSNYYLRVGDTGQQLALKDALGTPVVTTTGTNQVSLTYANSSLRAVVDYTLVGGASGAFDSRVSSSATLTNLGTDALDIHLFQYSDFDLKFDQANQLDQLRFWGPSSLTQYRSGTPYQLEASVGPDVSHYQGTDDFFSFYSIFFLGQGGPVTLNDTPSIGTLFPSPPKDSAFAFQWDRGLAAGASFRVDSRFQLTAVPEPSSLILAAAGLGAIVMVRRRPFKSHGTR